MALMPLPLLKPHFFYIKIHLIGVWKSFFSPFINQRKTWRLFYSLSYVMHTIENREKIPVIIPVQGKQEIAF